MNRASPIVGVPCCTKFIGEHDFHVVGGKYIRALTQSAGCAPILIPAVGDGVDVERVLGLVSGILLTGSVSNIAPELYRRYGEPEREPALPQDPARDATNLALIRAAIARGMPVLGICRGLQELNVAMGGTLHHAVRDVPGLNDHHTNNGEPAEIQYGPAHEVLLSEGGRLQQIFGGSASLTVNSVHGQGIDQLGSQLSIEAVAPDGLVEAISVRGEDRFALAVQWHPEWRATENRESTMLFSAFGEACREYQRASGASMPISQTNITPDLAKVAS